MPVFMKQFLLWCFSFLVIFLILPASNAINFGLPDDLLDLFSTDRLESNFNYYLFESSISSEPNKVVIGKGGWLFLGNHYANVLQQVRGEDNTSDADLSRWADEMKSKQDFHSTIGIETLFVIAPNKHSIYPEFLPDWINPATFNPVKKLESKAIDKGINFIHLADSLKREKSAAKLLYRKTDTHWNEYGSHIAYSKILASSSSLLNRNLASVKLSGIEHKTVNGGDLSAFLKIENSLQESDFIVNYDDKYTPVISKKIEYNPLNSSGKSRELKNQLTSVNKNGAITKNVNALNTQTLLWFRDSFGNVNSPLFQATFETIFQLHYNLTDSTDIAELLIKKQPDLILYQIVERNVLVGRFLKPYPDVINISSTFDKALLASAKILYKINPKEKTLKSNKMLSIDQSPDGIVLSVSEKTAKLSLPNIKSINKKNRILTVKMLSPHNTTLRLILTRNKTNENYTRTVVSAHITAGENTLYFYLKAKTSNHSIKIAPATHSGKYYIKELSIYQIK
jgi:hypothetical protein